jgi:hypothetical protein
VKRNKLWCVENLDDNGEGMILLLARDEETARTKAQKMEPQARITRCESVLWVNMALVSGERGQSYYFERNREKAC